MPDTIKEEEKPYVLEDFIEEEEDIDYQDVIDLSDEDEEKLIKLIEANLTQIDLERGESDCEERWRQYENQYWGVLQPSSDLIFNTHVFLTLKHVRIVKNRTMQAFFESDPVISVSTRPEYAKKDGTEAAELQEQFLDYELDTEMVIRKPLGQVFHDAILHDYGVAKLVWEKNVEDVRQIEEYKGNADGLKKFLDEYPDAKSKFPKYVNQLERGEDIKIVAYKPNTTYEAPKVYYVAKQNFYVSLTTDGLLGLRDAKFMAERQIYNWYELQDEVESKRFKEDKVEELQWKTDTKGVDVPNENLLSEKFEIFECPVYFPIKGKWRRIVAWYNRERRVVLQVISYPYDHGRPYYIPFFITDDLPGWLQPGLGRILQPQNIVANAIQNFTLDNGFYRNTAMIRVDPLSDVASQMMQKSFRIGDPLVARQGEVEKFDMNTGNMGDMFTLQAINSRDADDTVGYNASNMTGSADQIDPDAPAKKTLSLMGESNINIKAYILSLLPSFQELCFQILQLCGQFKDSAEFKRKRESVIGKSPQAKITAEQLKARTNLTANAYSFEFDKINEKRLNLSLAQMLTSNPLFMQIMQKSPQAVHALGKTIIKSWSNPWNMRVDEVWPTEEVMKQQLVEIQKEAIKQMQAEQMQQRQAQMAGQGGPRPQGQPQPGVQ